MDRLGKIALGITFMISGATFLAREPSGFAEFHAWLLFVIGQFLTLYQAFSDTPAQPSTEDCAVVSSHDPAAGNSREGSNL